MRQKISNLQFMFLTANFIFTSSMTNLPQIIIQITGQSTWLIPIILCPFLLFIVFLIFRGEEGNEQVKKLFLIGNKKERSFIFFFLLLTGTVFLRDLRGLIDFVASVLLPSTPINVLMILSILVITYMAMPGLEIISRINMMHFVILTLMVFVLPILLLNKIQLGNLQPFIHLRSAASIMKALFLSFSWMGELIFFFIIISEIKPLKAGRKAVISGTALGLLLFFIIMFLEIAVLGTKIIQEAVNPAYILVQQINITDFFERVDLMIVAVLLPAVMAKIAYLLYAINHCFSYFYSSNTNKFLFPISITLGLLSILLFKNTMDYLQFSFYTWSSFGLLLEIILVVLFLFVKKESVKKNFEKSEKPIG